MVRIHVWGVGPEAPPTIELAQILLKAEPGGESGWSRRFAPLRDAIGKEFHSASREEADLFIYGRYYEFGAQTKEMAETAARRGVPCLFFKWGDDPAPPVVPWGILVRHSILSGRRLANEMAAPAYCDDLLNDSGGAVPELAFSKTPRLGFCGYTSTMTLRLIYRLCGRVRKAEGLALRAGLLRILERSPGITCDFQPQRNFTGPEKGLVKNAPETEQLARRQFLESILRNDYTLCVRGAGNFSYRFYETLAAGRVPLFINTDCVLPYDDEIDWRKHCVWVEKSEMSRAGEILAEFHSRQTPDSMRAMQLANRRLWQEYLTPLTFYRNLFRKFMRAKPMRQA